MADVRLIKHEAVPNRGSYEVSFADGRPSRYFYFEDLAGRRVRPDQLARDQALKAAQAVPRVIRTHGAVIGSDSGMLSRKPSKLGRPAQRDTEMLFFLLIPWILFNIFTSQPLLTRN
jgi:hypothetical protein